MRRGGARKGTWRLFFGMGAGAGVIVIYITVGVMTVLAIREEEEINRCREYNLRRIGIALRMYAQDNGGSFPHIEPGVAEVANASGLPAGCVIAFKDKQGQWRASGLGLLIQGGYLQRAVGHIRLWGAHVLYCPGMRGQDEAWVRAFTLDEDERFFQTGQPSATDGDGIGELPDNPDVMVCGYVLRPPGGAGAIDKERIRLEYEPATVSDLLFCGEASRVRNHKRAYNVLFRDGRVRTFYDVKDQVARACRSVRPQEIEQTVDGVFWDGFDSLTGGPWRWKEKK